MLRLPPVALLVLLALLTLPRGGLAAPSLLAGGALTPRSPRLLATTPGAAAPAEALEEESGRTPAELGLGLLGLVVGGGLGYLLPGAAFCEGAQSVKGCATGYVAGTLLGAGLGASLGVTGGGALFEGQGEWITGALPGMLVGAAGGVGLGLAAGNEFVALLAAPPLMLLGSVIGYDWSHSAHASRSLAPVVSVTPAGARLGLMGRF